MIVKDILANSTIKLPVATITFHLNTGVYKYVNGELVKSNDDKIQRETTHPLISIKDNIAELTDGRFVKDIEHQKPTIHYGILEILEDNVKVCSKNGYCLRKVMRGQKFKVKEILKDEHNTTNYYSINKNEVISSKEAVSLICGYLVLNADKTIANNRKPLILKANTPYAFRDVYHSQVLLRDFDVWFEVEGTDYTISDALKTTK